MAIAMMPCGRAAVLPFARLHCLWPVGARVAGGGGFVGLAISSRELGMSAAAVGPDRQTDRVCGGVRNGDR
jgi:hypothetical protein